MGTQKQILQEKRKGNKQLFNEEIRSQASDEVSQKMVVAAPRGEDLPDLNLTDKEWCMQFVDTKKKVLLYTAKMKGDGQLERDTTFMYGRILRLDYEDSDSVNLELAMIDYSKGVRKVYLSEDHLVKKSCGPETFKIDLDNSLNLIVTLRPYIQGHKRLRDASPSPVKAPKKVSTVQSRPAKRKIS